MLGPGGSVGGDSGEVVLGRGGGGGGGDSGEVVLGRGGGVGGDSGEVVLGRGGGGGFQLYGALRWGCPPDGEEIFAHCMHFMGIDFDIFHFSV